MAYRLSTKSADNRLLRWVTDRDSVALIVIEGEGEESIELFRADTIDAMLHTYITQGCRGTNIADMLPLLCRCIHDGDPESWTDDVLSVFEHRLLLHADHLTDHSGLLSAYREGADWHVTMRGKKVAVITRDIPLPPPAVVAQEVLSHTEQPPQTPTRESVTVPPPVIPPRTVDNMPIPNTKPATTGPTERNNGGCLRALRMFLGLLIGIAIGLGAIYLVNHYLL